MLIVDAQVHIWSGGKPANPNHRQVSAFSKDDLPAVSPHAVRHELPLLHGQGVVEPKGSAFRVDVSCGAA